MTQPQIAAPLKVGFNSQEFEPSPLDELSKIQLTTDEQDITDKIPNLDVDGVRAYAAELGVNGLTRSYVIHQSKAGKLRYRITQRERRYSKYAVRTWLEDAE